VEDRAVKSPRFSPEFLELHGLFFLLGLAQALWYVPFSNVLKSHGLEHLVPYAFATAAIGSIISPLLSGAIADHHLGAERILRWLTVGMGAFTAAAFTAIERGWSVASIMLLLQTAQLFGAPTWALASAIALARLPHPDRQFGPVRVWLTLGWLSGGPIVSFLLHADSSTRSGFAAAIAWGCAGASTLLLPPSVRVEAKERRRWADSFGWKALSLPADRDQRAVLLGAALFSIPLAAFYPFVALQLRALGVKQIAASMALAQVSEVLTMYALASVVRRFRFKAIFLTALGVTVGRFLLFGLNSRGWLLVGIGLHGLCYTFFFVAAQIYLNGTMAPELRARAQALLTVMVSGVGTLLGALACGWWLDWCNHADGMRWNLYWTVLSGATLAVMIWFAMAFDGSRRREAG
jgi:MFS family permease